MSDLPPALPADPPAPPVEPPAPPAPPAETPEDIAADRDKWKHFAREHEKAAKANADAAKKLADIEAASLSDAEKKDKALADTAAERDAAKAELLRFRVAAAKGIPAEAADLLVGATEDEMNATADRLLAVMKSATPPPAGSADGGPRGPAPTDPTLDERIAAAQAKGDTRLAISLNSQKLAALATGSTA